jgi:hypothetical protein
VFAKEGFELRAFGEEPFEDCWEVRERVGIFAEGESQGDRRSRVVF